MTLKEMLEKKGNLVTEMRSFNDGIENRSFTSEEDAKWKEMNDDVSGLDAQISRMQTLAKHEDAEKRSIDAREEIKKAIGNETITPPVATEQRSADEIKQTQLDAIAGWCRNGSKVGVEQRHIDAAQAMGINLLSNEIEMRQCENAPSSIKELESRALSGLDGSAGGYTVPNTLIRSLERAKLQFGGMAAVSEVLRTSTGEEMEWPSSDDTSNTGEQVGENKAVTEQDVAFKSTKWNAYNFSSKMIKVPFTLLRDSSLNLNQILGSMLGERLGRIKNTKFTTGDGAATPYGIVNRAYLGKTTAGATAITADELIDLQHSVDIAYRMGAKWMLNDTVLGYIRKLKDGEGRYLLQDGLQLGVPSTLLGYQYQINNDMSSAITTGLTTVLFGDLSYYKIREVGTIRLKRLVERYAEYDQVAFIAFEGADGNLLDAGTHPVKKLVQA